MIDLSDLLAEYGTGAGPGYAVGVYRGGDLIAHASAGLAVLEHDVPVGVGTVFDLASASKQFTAACLVLLERDGVLSLEDDIRVHLPELWLRVPVTLRQCLTHTGGLREYTSLCELGGVPMAGMDEARLMPLLAGQAAVNFGPGTRWCYSNTGFVLAAAAVRRLTGMSLAGFGEERLFVPLEMSVTRFRDDLAVPVRGLATGYTPAAGGGWSRAENLEAMVGDGSLVCSVSDLARWQDFMLTGAVLGIAVRDRLLEPAVLADGRPLPYSLGLEIAAVGEHRLYLHAGHIRGFRSVLAYLVDEGLGIAVLANRDDTYPTEIAVRVSEQLLGLPATPPAARLDRAAAHAAQTALAGLWYSPELDLYATLTTADDGRLEQTEGDWRYRYLPLADGSWRCVEGATAIRLRLVAGQLWYEDVVGDAPPEIYRRVREPPNAAAPSGHYYSQELRAHASLLPVRDMPGAAALTVGLAKPAIVKPAAADEWAGSGLTIRMLDNAALMEVSCYGAQHIQFTLASGPAPPPQLGLAAP